MLSLAALFVVIVAVCLPLGLIFVVWLDGRARNLRLWDRAILAFWCGLLVNANVLLAYSIIGPLRELTALLLILAPALLITAATTFVREQLGLLLTSYRKRWIVLTLLLAATAHYHSQTMFWIDTGLYHYQLIKWLSEYGTVPGMALIHSRFGFTSPWFAIPAVLEQGWFAGRTGAVAGMLAMVTLTGMFGVSLSRWISAQHGASDRFIVMAGVLVLPIMFKFGISISPSPDLPVLLLALMVPWAILMLENTDSSSPQPVSAIALTLAALAVSVKLNAGALLAVVFLRHSFEQFRNKRTLFGAAAVIALLLMPLLTVNVISSGCPLYPFPVCLTSDYSVPVEHARALAEEIRVTARGRAGDPMTKTAFGWLVPWSAAPQNLLMAALTVLSVLGAIYLALSGPMSRGEKTVASIAVVGSLYVFVTAPSLRFGLPYLVMLPALALSRLTRHWRGMGVSAKMAAHAVLALLLTGIFVLMEAVRPNTLQALLHEALARGSSGHTQSSWLVPNAVVPFNPQLLEKENTAQAAAPIAVHARDFVYLKTDFCWDAEPPCTHQALDNIRLRDPAAGYARGFSRADE